jgi:hopene-associated glycosyltransferase HpnB
VRSRIAVVATGLVAATWGYLLLARGRFWSTSIRLPSKPASGSGLAGGAGERAPTAVPVADSAAALVPGSTPVPSRWPSVAIVVPARDEEDVLAITLPGLLAQDYPGRAFVVLVDDGSTDDTAMIARAAEADATTRLTLQVVAGKPRPPGWMGKLWALQQGIEHARDLSSTPGPDPEWLLLTDADIQHPPDSLHRMVAAAVTTGYDEVSLMARLRVATGWERLIIPAFVYFFAQLYPFRWVGRRDRRTAAAAGGCILVRRSALEAAGGIASVRGAVIDDVALAGRLKRSGAAIWLGLADDVCSVRPYPRLANLWHMVARSAYTQLRRSPWILAATLIGLVAVYVGPPTAVIAGAVTGDGWLAATGAIAFATIIATYLPTVRYYGLGWPWALTLPVAASVYAAMTADSARRHWQGRGVEWKGRRVGTLPSRPLG